MKIKLFKRSKVYCSDIYNLPVYLWNECKERSNFSFLELKNLNVDPETVEQCDDPKGYEAFLKVLNQRFKAFGVDKSLAEEMDIKEELNNINLLYCETGDRFLLNERNELREQLKEIQQQSKKSDTKILFSDEFAKVFKAYGGDKPMNAKKIMVWEFESAKMAISNG